MLDEWVFLTLHWVIGQTSQIVQRPCYMHYFGLLHSVRAIREATSDLLPIVSPK